MYLHLGYFYGNTKPMLEYLPLIAVVGFVLNIIIMYLVIQAATRSVNMERHAIAQREILQLIAKKSGASEDEVSSVLRSVYQ